ncbi:hypothetical protein SERLADRAFT_479237 [Serpula lacrymans var. lacrymans S7.9]|uniref:Uncharacterized protein n=1 Tax=Serpula lacrymans var. lacrymans (strain S7.9) TaxID=578457 RepID=F8PBH9_SERL9|nr:uncharacterized protein SERLADRAFT_479237 [Serpula lacrymans var. lacrymans S7.9]EGO19617.1 hypothetical protein SERLADRAFT_479237 [Serpula lacrymans var. lacrymans S7.9]
MALRSFCEEQNTSIQKLPFRTSVLQLGPIPPITKIYIIQNRDKITHRHVEIKSVHPESGYKDYSQNTTFKSQKLRYGIQVVRSLLGRY